MAGKMSREEVERDIFRTVRPSSLLQRFEQPEEIAAMVAFVVSPLASAITERPCGWMAVWSGASLDGSVCSGSPNVLADYLDFQSVEPDCSGSCQRESHVYPPDLLRYVQHDRNSFATHAVPVMGRSCILSYATVDECVFFD